MRNLNIKMGGANKYLAIFLSVVLIVLLTTSFVLISNIFNNTKVAYAEDPYETVSTLTLANILENKSTQKYGDWEWTSPDSYGANSVTISTKEGYNYTWMVSYKGSEVSNIAYVSGSGTASGNFGALFWDGNSETYKYMDIPGTRDFTKYNPPITFSTSVGFNIYPYGGTGTSVTITDLTLSVKKHPDSTVTITAGTGVKSVYLSTNIDATSGNPSGTKYAYGTQVTAFAVMQSGYYIPGVGNLVSGNIGDENSIFRIDQVSVQSDYDFGTINATQIGYPVDITYMSGCSSAYLSTLENATTGYESGHEFQSGDIVYGYVVMKTGYIAPNEWTLVPGTTDKYCIGSVEVETSETGFWYVGPINTINLRNWDNSIINTFTAREGTNLRNLYNNEIPVRDGYTFLGYYANQDGSGTKYYKADGSANNIPYWDGENQSVVNMYACFSKDIVVNITGVDTTWDGNSHGITVSVSDPLSGYVISYGATQGSYPDGAPSVYSNVGTYYTYVKITAPNYTTYEGVGTVRINKANSVINPLPTAIAKLEYTGENQALVTAGIVDYGSVLYAVSNELVVPQASAFSADIPTGHDVGTYYVFYKSTGDNDHNPYPASTENAITVTIAEVDKAALGAIINEVNQFINSIGESYVDISDALNAVKTIIKTNVYDNLDVTSTLVAQSVADLQEALSDAKAEVVKAKINAIGEVSYTQESKNKINAAREAYDALSDAQKQSVTNYNVLVAAEEIYTQLAAADTEAKINAIATPVKYPDSRDTIKAARDAYDALSDAQKKLIDEPTYKKLTDAEKEYNRQEDDATRQKVEDKENSVSIETDGTAGIPRNVELRVEVKTEVSSKEGKIDINAISAELKKTQKISKVYDVKLIQTIDGEEKEIQPSDIKEGMKIKIHMPIPEGTKTKGLSVLHIHDDGSIELISDVKIEGSDAIIEVDKLSQFALVEVKGHGFCVGWIVFIFVILELLATCLYVIIRYGFFKEFIAKCKLTKLSDKLDLMTFIGLCVAGGIFLFAFIALCCHQCALTIIMFILALIICCAFAYFFLKDKGFIDKWIKQCKDYLDKKKVKDEVKDEPQPKVEGQKEEPKEEPQEEAASQEAIAQTEAEAEKELESEKDDTIEEIAAKEKAHEALTLKDSLVLAKATTSSHTFSKKYVADYLRTKDIVEVNERENYTKTGLPLADTHYVDGKDGKKCFAYVYETEGSIILLAKMNDDYAQKLQEKHSQINKSAFPKQKNTWYSLIIDDTYTKEEFEGILDELIGEAKEDAGVSLKESIALAKASTAHSFTKAYVCEYLKDRNDVELNTRENFTKTGLPLADTHYVEKDGKKICFAYVYEIEGTMILLAKINSKYANELKKKHPQVNLSAFPKQKDTWYSLIIDDTYTKEEFEKILDDISK